MAVEAVIRKELVTVKSGVVCLLLFLGMTSCATERTGGAMAGAGGQVAPVAGVPVAGAAGGGVTDGIDFAQIDPASLYALKNPAKPRRGFPLTGFVADGFVGSTRCAVCHDLLVDGAGNDMSISNHWRSTMMANAAKDPLWLAKVSSEVARTPALKQVIEQKCASCHMPMAYTEIKAKGGYGMIFDQGFVDRENPLHQAAMDGVSCSLCHQIQDDKLGEKASFSGKYTIDTGITAPDRKIFGPYREPFQAAMRTSVGYTPEYGSHTNDSALCATCHTLFTPFVDGQGNVLGEFPEQTPYLEWLHSDFAVPVESRHDIGETSGQGRLCQECHMPHSKAGKVKIAKWTPKEAEDKDHFSQHHFVGGNILMLNILQDNIAYQEVSASTDQLQDTKQRTLDQLQTATASLAVREASLSGGRLAVAIKVINNTGHKFPTGIPIRRAWLQVSAWDAAGALLFESGRPMADGRIAGNDADFDLAAFEPHYDRITSSDQVQIYEGIMLDTDRQVTYTLLRAAAYAKDNRLLPAGFDKATASPDFGVFGDAIADGNFSGGSDQVVYEIDAKGHKGPFTVEAVLHYSPVSYAFFADLMKDDALSLVDRFGRFFQRADKQPVPVAAVRVRVP